MALLPFLLSAVAGYLGGRYGGSRGWLVLLVVAVVPVLASVATEGFVDPILAVFVVLWMLVAAVGVGVGLLRRRRALTSAV